MPHFHVPETGFLQMYLCLLFFFFSRFVICIIQGHASYKSPTKVTFLKPLEVVRQKETGGILSINQHSQGDKKNIQFTVPAPFHLSTAISIRKN